MSKIKDSSLNDLINETKKHLKGEPNKGLSENNFKIIKGKSFDDYVQKYGSKSTLGVKAYKKSDLGYMKKSKKYYELKEGAYISVPNFFTPVFVWIPMHKVASGAIAAAVVAGGTVGGLAGAGVFKSNTGAGGEVGPEWPDTDGEIDEATAKSSIISYWSDYDESKFVEDNLPTTIKVSLETTEDLHAPGVLTSFPVEADIIKAGNIFNTGTCTVSNDANNVVKKGYINAFSGTTTSTGAHPLKNEYLDSMFQESRITLDGDEIQPNFNITKGSFTIAHNYQNKKEYSVETINNIKYLVIKTDYKIIDYQAATTPYEGSDLLSASLTGTAKKYYRNGIGYFTVYDVLYDVSLVSFYPIHVEMTLKFDYTNYVNSLL